MTELAHHFDRSGNVSKAVEYLARTGAGAAMQAAHSEAIGYFNRALELLLRLPEGVARDRQELDLQIAFNWSLYMAKGVQASPQRQSALVRARELCERLGDAPRLIETLVSLALFHYNGRDFGQARDLAEKVLSMAPQDPAVFAVAHFVLGLIAFSSGQFPTARELFERAVELSDAGSPRNASFIAFAPGVASMMFVSVLIILGYPMTALRRVNALRQAGRRASDPDSSLIAELMLHLLFRDARTIAARADELLSIATEHENVFTLNLATFLRGWVNPAYMEREALIAGRQLAKAGYRLAALLNQICAYDAATTWRCRSVRTVAPVHW